MTKRVFVTGVAGLVGQNLLAYLPKDWKIIGIDKHRHNLDVVRRLHPDIVLIEGDCAESGAWETELASCDALVMLHAEIGGLSLEPFIRNNVTATERVVAAASRGQVSYMVHVSSSVVHSSASDFYTETKKKQEQIVRECPIPHAILRPTLMFGWFDRKHLGWLKRFLEKSPIFPIPGDGKYLRQPLYAGDFSAIIAACLDRQTQGAFNISGFEKIYYIDLIREIRAAAGLRTPIVRVPYRLFWLLLTLYGFFNRNPPFTTQQLEALATPDIFEVIDWPGIFGVKATALHQALVRTFQDPVYSHVFLEF